MALKGKQLSKGPRRSAHPSNSKAHHQKSIKGNANNSWRTNYFAWCQVPAAKHDDLADLLAPPGAAEGTRSRCYWLASVRFQGTRGLMPPWKHAVRSGATLLQILPLWVRRRRTVIQLHLSRPLTLLWDASALRRPCRLVLVE